MMAQVGEPAELVPFELLHLELVSHIIHGRQYFIARAETLTGSEFLSLLRISEFFRFI